MNNIINKIIFFSIFFVLTGVQGLYACGPGYYDAHHGYRDYLNERWMDDYYFKLFYPNDSLTARHNRGRTAYRKAVRLEQNGDFDKALKSYSKALQEFNGFHIGGNLVQSRMDYVETINWLQDKVDMLTYRENPHNLRLLKEFFNARDSKNIEKLKEIANSKTIMSDPAMFLVAKKLKDESSYWLDKYLKEYPNGRYKAEAMGWKAYYLIRIDRSRPTRERYIEANKIYLKIIENPKLHTMFYSSVESLSFRYFLDNPPRELLKEPLFLTGYIQKILRSNRSWRYSTKNSKPNGNHINDIVKMAKNAFNEDQINALSPKSAEKLAVAFCRINENKLTRRLALKALKGRGSSISLYLLGRLAVENGNAKEAEKRFNEIALEFPFFSGLRELGIRLGALYEKQGNMKKALLFYIRSGSMEDCRIITDGEISLKEMLELLEENPDIHIEPALKDKPFKIADRHLLSDSSKKNSIKTFLYKRLGVMFARAGKLKAAYPYFSDYRKRAHAASIILRCEKELEKADPDNRSESLYQLGAAWYHHGHKVLYNGTSWLYYYFKRGSDWTEEDWKKMGKEPWKTRVKIAESMNKYYRALPYFLEVIKKHPESPQAPKALYSAALCYYWAKGKSGYYCYFPAKAKRENFWEKGSALMKRIPNEYPNHPLAKSKWIYKLFFKEKNQE